MSTQKTIQLLDYLTRRPVSPAHIDAMFRLEEQLPRDPAKFHLNWYAVLSPELTAGKTFVELRADPDFEAFHGILDFLDRSYFIRIKIYYSFAARPVATLLLLLALLAGGCVSEDPTAAYRRLLYEQCDFLTPTLITVSARPGAETWKCQAAVTDYNRVFVDAKDQASTKATLVYIDPPTDIESARR